MAKENITKFFEAAAADQALAEKLAALAAENGYAFTAAELLELGVTHSITDEELLFVTAAGITGRGITLPKR